MQIKKDLGKVVSRWRICLSKIERLGKASLWVTSVGRVINELWVNMWDKFRIKEGEYRYASRCHVYNDNDWITSTLLVPPRLRLLLLGYISDRSGPWATKMVGWELWSCRFIDFIDRAGGLRLGSGLWAKEQSSILRPNKIRYKLTTSYMGSFRDVLVNARYRVGWYLKAEFSFVSSIAKISWFNLKQLPLYQWWPPSPGASYRQWQWQLTIAIIKNCKVQEGNTGSTNGTANRPGLFDGWKDVFDVMIHGDFTYVGNFGGWRMAKLQPSRLLVMAVFPPWSPDPSTRQGDPGRFDQRAKIPFPSSSESHKPRHPFVGSTYSLWELLGFKLCQMSCGHLHLLAFDSKRGGARLFKERVRYY